MNENTRRGIDTLYKFLMPILTALATWMFAQFWDIAKELRNELVSLKIEVISQSKDMKIGLEQQQHALDYHIAKTVRQEKEKSAE